MFKDSISNLIKISAGSNIFKTLGDSKNEWIKIISSLIITIIAYIVISYCIELFIIQNSLNDSYAGVNWVDPLALTLSCFKQIVIIIILFATFKLFKLKTFNKLLSFNGALKIKKIILLTFLALIISFAVNIIALIIFNNNEIIKTELNMNDILLLIFISLTLVPLQCFGEELLFRGCMTHVIGHFIPVAIIPIIMQAALFSSFHAYNILGIISVFITGVLYGIMYLATRGIEAPLAAHSATNITSIMLSSFGFSKISSTITFESFILSIVLQIIIFIVISFVSYKCFKENS